MKTKVLLVDDDVPVLAALSSLLRAEGYDVTAAFDGQDALQKFHAIGGADIVLLDLNMPIQGGWETFAQLTAINPLLPIIVITARPDQSSLAAAARVAALIEKPLDIPLLLATMRNLLAEPPESRLARVQATSRGREATWLGQLTAKSNDGRTDRVTDCEPSSL